MKKSNYCIAQRHRETAFVCWWECGLDTESSLLDLFFRLTLYGGAVLGRKAQLFR